jgi:hypothetical protein
MHWPMITKDNCDTQRLLFSKDHCYTISRRDGYLWRLTLREMFMDLEAHEEWNFTYILKIIVYCENEKYSLDEDVCWGFSNVKSSIGL